jgi:hypothetical protein
MTIPGDTRAVSAKHKHARPGPPLIGIGRLWPRRVGAERVEAGERLPTGLVAVALRARSRSMGRACGRVQGRATRKAGPARPGAK